MNDFDRLVRAVQANCHIADARHARDMTMCNYLLAMRDLYRWECDLPLGIEPDRKSLGRWLREREGLWATLETASYGRIPVGALEFDPFDADGINAGLAARGLAYGAGRGRFGRSHFFLGALERHERRDGHPLRVIGCEYARDVAAFPAACQRGSILLRQDALERWVHDRIVQFGAAPRDRATARVAASCGLNRGVSDGPMLALIDAVGESVIAHEIGEAAAAARLSARWSEMLGSLRRPRAEYLARAVRDNLADCLCTVPQLIERESACAIDFFFASFEGPRRKLFPRLLQAYAQWCDSGDVDALAAAAREGSEHWERIAFELLSLWHRSPDGALVEGLAAGGSEGIVF